MVSKRGLTIVGPERTASTNPQIARNSLPLLGPFPIAAVQQYGLLPVAAVLIVAAVATYVGATLFEKNKVTAKAPKAS